MNAAWGLICACYRLLAGLTVAVWAGLWIMYLYGAKLRANSWYAIIYEAKLMTTLATATIRITA
jgi:hypothetical protein